ncbi:hypothetical protein DMJ13_04835 [halophilic archaeon]|nr:hypothetical protein DMJ13_04835 [halophilic archaeon]
MLSFEPLDTGLEVVDAVEGRRYVLDSSESLSPAPADPDRFRFPVDSAVEVETSEFRLVEPVEGFVRDETGDSVLQVSPGTRTDLPSAAYSVELNAPVKLYLRVDGALTVDATADLMIFRFDPPVLVGARSYHHHPAATVTTTDDPRDVFAAVSTLSSALKTTSPERSYPTLRGHPPLVERGDELRIPDELTAPETGVRIELPPTLRAATVAAPLSYYLGAELVPGDDPRLVVDGDAHSLAGPPGFERNVERTLKRAFLLDCLVRTEGYYQVDLYEREQVASDVDLDFASLYDASLAERLDATLAVPFETLAPHVPRWPLVAHVDPTPEAVAVLPFVAYDLGVVRTADARRASPDEVQSSVLDAYLGQRRGGAGDESEDDSPFVALGDADAVEQVWFGDGVPLDATKGIPAAFHNDLRRDVDPASIDITVVCNECEMTAEQAVAETVYGSREQLPFDVTLRRDCSTDELRAILASSADLLHYVGHVDDDGFRCRDGTLDAETVDSTGVHAFLLNACRSYEQGVALVEAGAVGGVVTFSDVVDSGAVRVGRTLARLLNLGFPLRSALQLAAGESIVGGHYLVVGDGSVDVVQVEDGIPTLCDVETAGSEYEVTPVTYPSREAAVGTMAYPLVGSNEQHFLAPGELATFRLSEPELREYLSAHGSPVRKDGELVWDDPP